MVEKPPMVIKRLGIIADSKLASSNFDELLRANPKEAAISYTYTLVKVPFTSWAYFPEAAYAAYSLDRSLLGNVYSLKPVLPPKEKSVLVALQHVYYALDQNPNLILKIPGEFSDYANSLLEAVFLEPWLVKKLGITAVDRKEGVRLSLTQTLGNVD
ncbi:MAG: hypothetical protein ACP5T4_02210 [Candidatus Micrarchaeia archaeon]